MNKSCIQSLFVAVIAGGLPSLAQASFVAYNNSTTDLGVRFDPGTDEVGDQIILAPFQPAKVTEFAFQYWGTGFSGNELAQVRFYANDGPISSGAATPGTMLWNSGTFGIAATPRNTLTFDTDFGSGLLVPGTFTWSVQFSGIEVGEAAGVDLYSPPTGGNNYPDYWHNDTVSGWELMTGPQNMDFAARLTATAVPEPSAMFAGAGLALLAALRYRFNKAKAKA